MSILVAVFHGTDPWGINLFGFKLFERAVPGLWLPSMKSSQTKVGIIKRNWREYCGTLRPLHAERQQDIG